MALAYVEAPVASRIDPHLPNDYFTLSNIEINYQAGAHVILPPTSETQEAVTQTIKDWGHKRTVASEESADGRSRSGYIALESYGETIATLGFHEYGQEGEPGHVMEIIETKVYGRNSVSAKDNYYKLKNAVDSQIDRMGAPTSPKYQ